MSKLDEFQKAIETIRTAVAGRTLVTREYGREETVTMVVVDKMGAKACRWYERDDNDRDAGLYLVDGALGVIDREDVWRKERELIQKRYDAELKSNEQSQNRLKELRELLKMHDDKLTNPIRET